MNEEKFNSNTIAQWRGFPVIYDKFADKYSVTVVTFNRKSSQFSEQTFYLTKEQLDSITIKSEDSNLKN